MYPGLRCTWHAPHWFRSRLAGAELQAGPHPSGPYPRHWPGTCTSRYRQHRADNRYTSGPQLVPWPLFCWYLQYLVVWPDFLVIPKQNLVICPDLCIILYRQLLVHTILYTRVDLNISGIFASVLAYLWPTHGIGGLYQSLWNKSQAAQAELRKATWLYQCRNAWVIANNFAYSTHIVL